MATAKKPIEHPAQPCASYALSVEPRLVTLKHDGVTVASSSCAIRAERPGASTVYFVPADDVAHCALEASGKLVSAPGLGRARVVDVRAGEDTLEAAAFRLEEATELGARLIGRVGFDASRFERDERASSSID